MITTKLTVSGIEYFDYNFLKVNSAVSDNNTVSNFQANYDSPYGRHKSDFPIGQEVIVYADSVPILPNIVAQYKMNDGSGTKVTDSINALNGSLVSGTWNKGLIGSAINLTGSPILSYVDIGSFIPSFPSVGTISFWANRATYGSNLNTNRNLFLIGSTNNDGTTATSDSFKLIDRTTAGQNRFDFKYVISGATSFNIQPTSNNATGDSSGTWFHLATTWAGSNAYANLYFNGSNVGSAIQVYPIAMTNMNMFRIGAGSGGARAFAGMIDDFRIYNSSLSNSDISNIYNSGIGTEKSSENQNIFTGIVEDVNFIGTGLNETVEVRGRDYTGTLMDNNILPVVYTNMEVGSIVRDILKNNTTDIGSANVNNPGIILKRIAFNQHTIFEAFKQLADISNFVFYVDSNKGLHFETIGSTFTGVSLNSGNIIYTQFDQTKQGMANKIYVYGDRTLTAAPVMKLSVGSPTGGSVFTLNYPPFNTNVSILGSVQVGGVFNNQVSASSGTNYLVSFNDMNLIFPSGTTYGYYLPPSGGSIVVNYDRQIPIVKYGEDTVSIKAFRPKTLVITDKSIKDPNAAVDRLNTQLQLTNPLNNIECDLAGWFSFQPNQTVNLSVPDFNLNVSQVPIISIDYNFTPENAAQENVIKVRLDSRQLDITDKIREMNNRISFIESQDKQSTDVITRLQYSTGSMQVVGSYWEVRMQYNGSEFRVWDSNNFAKGSGGTPLLGLLYSGAGITGSISYLASGTFGTGFKVITSGGYSY